MRWRSLSLIIGGAAAVVCASALAPAAHAEDFLSALFGAFGARPQAPAVRLSYANEGDARAPQSAARPRSGYSGGSQAYCVRTCDGRYFPISGSNGQSRAASASRNPFSRPVTSMPQAPSPSENGWCPPAARTASLMICAQVATIS